MLKPVCTTSQLWSPVKCHVSYTRNRQHETEAGLHVSRKTKSGSLVVLAGPKRNVFNAVTGIYSVLKSFWKMSNHRYFWRVQSENLAAPLPPPSTPLPHLCRITTAVATKYDCKNTTLSLVCEIKWHLEMIEFSEQRWYSSLSHLCIQSTVLLLSESSFEPSLLLNCPDNMRLYMHL